MPIIPSDDQMAAFAADTREGPIHMLNLLKFRERADYGDDAEGIDTDCSGAEAYGRYGAVAAKAIAEIGGRMVWQGVRELLVIGEPGKGDGDWDVAAIVEYPSREAFFKMMQIPYYQDALKHRAAGLLRQQLIKCNPVGSLDNP